MTLHDDVLAELEELFSLEERQEGDVTAMEVGARLGIHHHTAADKMQRLVNEKKYTRHEVRGRAGKTVYVYRKVIPA